jgi:PHD/YefM family antitoxin component YafN of YafNO toxin-antitoxin module
MDSIMICDDDEVRIMATTDAEYVVDKRGRKKAVLLNIKEYSRLLSRLEELEDALDLDNAVRSGREFRDYREIRKELLKEERL